MIKVFISHQKNDVAVAQRIEVHLRTVHGIPSYLDLIDPALGRRGEDLALHLREQMDSCTQLLAVISPITRASWWVPWEIGVASEKDYPLATFADGTPVPEFLEKWPYLRSESDLDKYAIASKNANLIFENRRLVATASTARRDAAKQFYTKLRTSLNQ